MASFFPVRALLASGCVGNHQQQGVALASENRMPAPLPGASQADIYRTITRARRAALSDS